LFQPLLYQVATGSLAPGQVAAPLRGILRKQANTSVLLGEAVDLDAGKGTVLLADGDSIEYDSLIVATGSESSYFGNDEWRRWAPSLKSMEEATAIRHKILYAFESAERSKSQEDRRAWLTFVVVGAGATGVELAGALLRSPRVRFATSFARSGPKKHRSSFWTVSRVCSPRIPRNCPPKRNDPSSGSACASEHMLA
jgi:NADH dehydrogenase